MNTLTLKRAALAASVFAVVLTSGCASLDNVLTSTTQTPAGDVDQPNKAGVDPILQEMARESQLG